MSRKYKQQIADFLNDFYLPVDEDTIKMVYGMFTELKRYKQQGLLEFLNFLRKHPELQDIKFNNKFRGICE